MITTNAISLKNQLNSAQPGQLADMLRAVLFGNVLRAAKTYLRNLDPNTAAANPYIGGVAVGQSIQLPDDAKGLTLLRAYARGGTGTHGPLVVDAPDSWAGAPAARHVAISPSGDLVFHAADAWTNVDVAYEPEKYDTFEVTLAVPASGILPLPAPYVVSGVVILMEAEAITGTVTGKAKIGLPGTAAATAEASLDLAKANVVFLAADAVTQARVKFGVVPAVDVNALLEAASNFI